MGQESKFVMLSSKIEKIRYCQYATLIKDANVLAHDQYGRNKVFLTPDKKIIKTFHVSHFLKELFSSRMMRFLKAVSKLRQKNVATIYPENYYRCISPKLNIVVYPYVEGASLRDVSQQNIGILKEFAFFLAHLHRMNIYFRGIHLNNVVVGKNQNFTLIDVSNTKFKVNIRRRAKNIAYVLKYPADFQTFKQYGVTRFLNDYLNAAQLNKREEKIFRKYLHHYINE